MDDLSLVLLLLIIRSRPFVGAGKCLASCLHRDYGPHRSARSGHALPYAGNGVVGARVISEYPHADRLRVLRVTCTVPCRVVTWPLRRLPLAQPRTLRRFVDTPLRPGPSTNNAPWHHCGKCPWAISPLVRPALPCPQPGRPLHKGNPPHAHLEHGYIFALNYLHVKLSTTHQGPIVLSIHNHNHHHHQLSIDSRIPSRPTPAAHIHDPNPPCLRIDPDKRLPTSALSRLRRPIPHPTRIYPPARLPDPPPDTAWILRSGQLSRSPSSGACGVRGPRKSPRPTTRAPWAWSRSAPTSTTAIAAQRWLATPEAEAGPSSNHALRGVATTPDLPRRKESGPVQAESELEF